MKTNLVRILSIGFLSLFLLFCLAACGTEETTPVDPAPSEPAAAVELPDTPELKLNDDGTGTYADLITDGNNKALATVYFHYEGDTLTNVDSVRVKPVEGWTSIEQDAELDVEGIVYGEGKTWATVPFLYYASIGAGLEVYDGYVLVDLQYREG